MRSIKKSIRIRAILESGMSTKIWNMLSFSIKINQGSVGDYAESKI